MQSDPLYASDHHSHSIVVQCVSRPIIRNIIDAHVAVITLLVPPFYE